MLYSWRNWQFAIGNIFKMYKIHLVLPFCQSALAQLINNVLFCILTPHCQAKTMAEAEVHWVQRYLVATGQMCWWFRSLWRHATAGAMTSPPLLPLVDAVYDSLTPLTQNNGLSQSRCALQLSSKHLAFSYEVL